MPGQQAVGSYILCSTSVSTYYIFITYLRQLPGAVHGPEEGGRSEPGGGGHLRCGGARVCGYGGGGGVEEVWRCGGVEEVEEVKCVGGGGLVEVESLQEVWRCGGVEE